MYSIKKNLAQFKLKLKNVCKQHERDPNEITVIAVTKKHSAEEANELIQAGIKTIGENRIQEALDKFPDLLPCEKHLVGHLQTNKAREAVRSFDCVESVDSLKLVNKLNTEAAKINKILPIFIQANLSREPQKSGFLEEELAEAISEIKKLSNLKIEGLMLMGIFGDLEKTREVFLRGKKLCDQFNFTKYSAGMSDDWQIAVECGATHLRVGEILFAFFL